MKRLRWSKLCAGGEAFHILRAHLKGPRAAPIHSQDFPEVFWVERGEGLHTVNGEAIPIARGDMVFVRSTDWHALSSRTGSWGFVLVNIAFAAATLDFLHARYFAQGDRWFWRRSPLPAMLRLDPERLAWLERWVDRLDSGPRSLLNIEVFLMELFRDLEQSQPPPGREAGPQWLREALGKASEPAVFSGGTEALARAAGRTPQHLNASLRKYHGITATEAVNAARMEFAGRELRTSTKKIIEICLDCGFQNLAHFYRVFRHHFGKTPREYRRIHQRLLQ